MGEGEESSRIKNSCPLLLVVCIFGCVTYRLLHVWGATYGISVEVNLSDLYFIFKHETPDFRSVV